MILPHKSNCTVSQKITSERRISTLSLEHYENLQIRKTEEGEIIVQYLQTTTGRVILNYTIQKTLNLL